MVQAHQSFKCETTGLHLDKDSPFIDASPDGIVSRVCHGLRTLEIKCSIKHKDVSPADILNIDKKYPVVLDSQGKLKVKSNSKWFYQMQQQMGVLGVKSCDLVLYTKLGLSIIPVDFDRSVWDMLKTKAKNLFLNDIVPHIIKETEKNSIW